MVLETLVKDDPSYSTPLGRPRGIFFCVFFVASCLLLLFLLPHPRPATKQQHPEGLAPSKHAALLSGRISTRGSAACRRYRHGTRVRVVIDQGSHLGRGGLLLVRKKSDSYRTTYFARVVAIRCKNSTRQLG